MAWGKNKMVTRKKREKKGGEMKGKMVRKNKHIFYV